MAVSNYKTLNLRYKAIAEIYPIADHANISQTKVSDQILTWARETLTKFLATELANCDVSDTRRNKGLNREEGEAMADLTRYFPEQMELLTDLYAPAPAFYESTCIDLDYSFQC